MLFRHAELKVFTLLQFEIDGVDVAVCGAVCVACVAKKCRSAFLI